MQGLSGVGEGDATARSRALDEGRIVTTLHVAILRRLAVGERIPAEWMTRQSTPDGLADLMAAELAEWDAGGGLSPASGAWVLLRVPGHVITKAGRAALLFYELGRAAGSYDAAIGHGR
jgi:hypothetical protein